jgi:predicted nucleic acid-binding protein
MSRPAIVLDSGVLDQAVTDRMFRQHLDELAERDYEAIVPTVTLVETITGRPQDAATNQAVNQLGTVDTDQPVARRAGALRYRATRSGVGRSPSAIDAIVAAHAAEVGVGVVFTTDPTDLERLLAAYPRIHVERP